MKELRCSVYRNFCWWRSDGRDVAPEHVEPLTDHAQEHINAMLQEGYTAGQLYECVSVPGDDPALGVEYVGWWDTATKPVEIGEDGYLDGNAPEFRPLLDAYERRSPAPR